MISKEFIRKITSPITLDEFVDIQHIAAGICITLWVIITILILFFRTV